LRFESSAALARSLKTRSLKSKDVETMLAQVEAATPRRAARVARAVVEKRKNGNETREALHGLTRWATASSGDRAARCRTVARAFRGPQRKVLLVHAISQLPAEEARELMAAYFAEGGDLAPVTRWLGIAGGKLNALETAPRTATTGARATRRRTRGVTRRTKGGLLGAIADAAGDVAGFVGGAVGDAAGAVGDAVSTVVDAVVSAGKSVAEAIGSAASWTLEKTTDLVRALIRAGKTVGEILTAALQKSVLGKYVRALLAAGRALSEILVWAAVRTAAVVRDVVAAVLAAGRSVANVVLWAAGQTLAIATRLVRALLDAGRRMAEIVTAALRMTGAVLRRLIAAIYQAGRDLASILIAAARCAASVIRTVFEGLFMVGATLAMAVASICRDVAAGFRRGLFEGLIALGYALLDLLKAAAVAGVSVLALAFAVALEICGGHRALTPDERREARRIFGWSIDLDRVKIAVASLPADLINWLNGQRTFTTMYVINFASWDHVVTHTLIHELTHVWQATVAGPVYMVEALHSQFFGRGYEVTDADLAAANGDITKLEREQQAVVVERYWIAKFGGGLATDVAKYEPLAQDVFRPEPASSLLARLRVGPLPVLRVVRRPQRVLLALND
jgi:hypothetical protein